MTQDEAVDALKQCTQCDRWITTTACDHCWVDNHKCPPTLTVAIDDLNRAVELGTEAKKILARLTR